MEYTKEELEQIINNEIKIAKYVYDIHSNSFYCRVEVIITLIEHGNNIYKSSDSYIIDGYEFGLSGEQVDELSSEGSREAAKTHALNSFHKYLPKFRDYPIEYTNIRVIVIHP